LLQEQGTLQNDEQNKNSQIPKGEMEIYKHVSGEWKMLTDE
jgi:hypothetical protein